MRAASRLAMLLLLAACGGEPKSEPAQKPTTSPPPKGDSMPTLAQICEAHCDRAAACGTAERSSCQRECVAQGRSVSHLRGEFVWRLLSCLDSLDCGVVAEGRAFPACFETSRYAVPLTPTLRSFCFDSARRAASCGRRAEADQSECRDRYRHLNDRALSDGQKCLEGPCAEIPACFKRRFGM